MTVWNLVHVASNKKESVTDGEWKWSTGEIDWTSSSVRRWCFNTLTILSARLCAAMTGKGGFLVIKDFGTRYSQPLSCCLAWGLQLELEESSRANCYYLYLDCLNVLLRTEMSTLRYGNRRNTEGNREKRCKLAGFGIDLLGAILGGTRELCITNCSAVLLLRRVDLLSTSRMPTCTFGPQQALDD